MLMKNQHMEVWSQSWFPNVSKIMALNLSSITRHYHTYNTCLQETILCTTSNKKNESLSFLSAGASSKTSCHLPPQKIVEAIILINIISCSHCWFLGCFWQFKSTQTDTPITSTTGEHPLRSQMQRCVACPTIRGKGSLPQRRSHKNGTDLEVIGLKQGTWGELWKWFLLLMEEIRLTSWYGKYPIIYKDLYMSGGCLGFLNHQQYLFWYLEGACHFHDDTLITQWFPSAPQNLHQNLSKYRSAMPWKTRSGSTKITDDLLPTCIIFIHLQGIWIIPGWALVGILCFFMFLK